MRETDFRVFLTSRLGVNAVRSYLSNLRATERMLNIDLDTPTLLPTLLAGVLFDCDMGVLRAALIPHRVVAEQAKWTAHTNSWRFMLTDAVWKVPSVRDATAALRDAPRTL